MTVSFFVPGVPRPQGSKRHVGGGRMVESSKYVKDWRHDITQAAFTYRLDMLPFDCPVVVDVVFRMPRPKSHFRSNGWLRESAPAFPTARPDVDKLARAVLDAVSSAGLWRDDSLVVDLVARKRYPLQHTDPVGVSVEIRPLIDGGAA